MKTNSGVIWTSQTGKTRTIQNVPYYDVVIRTQAEFEALYNNATWFDATSVLFVGDGGALKFTRSDGKGIKIPQTVRQIQGMNNATIEITNFVYSDSNRGGIFYATLPTQNGTTKTESLPGYGIDSLLVNCTGTGSGLGLGFHNCTQLTNCTGTGTGTGSGSSYGFYSCTQLTNCTGTGTGTGYSGYGFGFYNCTQLTNCTGTGTGNSGSGYGFYSCTQLTNCTGTGTGTGNRGNGYGFDSCTQLTNCTGTGTGNSGYNFGFYNCTQLTNCTGTGTVNSGNGYGFYDCSWVNGCKQGAQASSTAFTGGTMQHVDTATVVAS